MNKKTQQEKDNELMMNFMYGILFVEALTVILMTYTAWTN